MEEAYSSSAVEGEFFFREMAGGFNKEGKGRKKNLSRLAIRFRRGVPGVGGVGVVAEALVLLRGRVELNEAQALGDLQG
jgi:hypothetical protein